MRYKQGSRFGNLMGSPPGAAQEYPIFPWNSPLMSFPGHPILGHSRMIQVGWRLPGLNPGVGDEVSSVAQRGDLPQVA